MFAAPVQQTTKGGTFPAPAGGINALDNLMSMPPSDCVASYNLLPQTYGMKVRRGYEEVNLNFSGDSTEARTLIPYTGSDTSKDALFAVTQEGIYDVTTSGDSYPTPEYSWGDTSGFAGFCNFTIYTTIADKFLFVADEVNGLVRYEEDTPTWTVPTFTGDLDTDGYDASDIVYVTVWKQRIWLVLRDSASAYYLDTGLVAGNTTRFDFGNKFIAGGFLKSLHNFTVDGGSGADDYLIALSSAGDVVAYKGTNPDSITTFDMTGVWNIGHLPAHRRVTSEIGGDLYVICSYGVVSVTQILKGTDPGTLPAYITGKITPLVQVDVTASLDLWGWAIVAHPQDGMLILIVPSQSTAYERYRQYVMNTNTRAWTQMLGVPMICAASWKGKLYFGAHDVETKGRVYKYAGTKDNVRYGEDISGTPISGFVLSTFQALGGGGETARMHFLKPQFIAAGTPLYELEARYDFDIRDYVSTIAGAFPALSVTGWPDAWGTVAWDDTLPTPVSELRGVAGIGKFGGVALTTRTLYETTLIGFTVMYDTGGLL